MADATPTHCLATVLDRQANKQADRKTNGETDEERKT